MKLIIFSLIIVFCPFLTFSQEEHKYEAKAYELFKKGKHKAAIKLYDKDLQENPSDSYSLFIRALCKIELRQFKEALPDLKKALELTSPNKKEDWEYLDNHVVWKRSTDYKYYDAYFYIAFSQFYLERYGDALDNLNLLLGYDKNIEYSYYLLGACYYEFNLYDKAIDNYDRYLQTVVNDKRAYLERGICLLYLERKEEACVDLNKALKLGEKQAKNIIKEYCGK